VLEREPYLQSVTPTSITVVWRSTSATSSRVQYGTVTTDQDVIDATVTTDHVVTIQGLTPDTKYFYNVGSTTTVEGGGTPDHFFRTAPPTGIAAPFSAWIVGDSGTGTSRQTDVLAAMFADTAGDPPDLYLHVGDIAYSDGTDTEFTNNHFAIYPNVLRNTPFWPTMGNHEADSSDSPTQTGPYYEAFVLPSIGEAGGVPSLTEAYYSFDYAHVHFIVIDTADTSLAPGATMLNWLIDDLMDTTQQWLVAIFHHPPYTKGSHDSDDATDSGGRHLAVRENLVPILEAGGVDLVLTGHSHSYERSYLIDGVHCPTCGAAPDLATPDFATLQSAGHIHDATSGDPATTGAYAKTPGLNSNDGAVYVVAGHGGASLSLSSLHPVMFFAEADHGSCILTVDGDILSVRNIRHDGVITDRFSIRKNTPECTSNADCNDSNLCTTDICDVPSRACSNSETVVCQGISECDGGKLCNPATGACDDLPDPPAGTPCTDDGNVCTDVACDGAGLCAATVNVVPGECNGNGVLDAGDPICIILCLIGEAPSGADCQCGANCNCVASVEASDPICGILRLIDALDVDLCDGPLNTPQIGNLLQSSPVPARLRLRGPQSTPKGKRARARLTYRGVAAHEIAAVRATISSDTEIVRLRLSRRLRRGNFTLNTRVSPSGDVVELLVTTPLQAGAITGIGRGRIANIRVAASTGKASIIAAQFGSTRGTLLEPRD
jgi:hypothetical protein